VINPRGDISGAKKIGEEITEILEYTPGKFYVEKTICFVVIMMLQKTLR